MFSLFFSHIDFQVVDPFGLNATTKVIIKITDINDNTPVVENYGEQFLIDYDVTPGQRYVETD